MMPNPDYETVLENVRKTKAEYPELKIGTLGHSMLGKEIPVLTLGEGKEAVVFAGTFGGMEAVTAGILLDFISDYLKMYRRDAQINGRKMSFLFRERRILLVPMLNPDGADYVIHGLNATNPMRDRVIAMNHKSEDLSGWQANARGVDLTCNYDADFSGQKIREAAGGLVCGGPVGYGGEYPESEPETAAFCRLLRQERENLRGVLALQTGEERIFCSCRDALSAKSLSVGRILQRMTGYKLMPPDERDDRINLTDWCVRRLGKPAYILRCGDPAQSDKMRFSTFQKLRNALFSFPFLA